MAAPLPLDERDRLATLHACGVLEIEDDPLLECVVGLGAKYFDAPICHIAMIDSSRTWLKAKVGLDVREGDRNLSFSAHAILSGELLIVEDASLDPRFAQNPFVAGQAHLRFYAGAPINTRFGSKIGCLCVMDSKPRAFSDKDAVVLRALASIVAQSLLARQQLNDAVAALADVESTAKDSALLLSQVSHELKTPLNQILGFSEIMESEMFGPIGNPKYHDYIRIIGHSAQHLNALVDATLNIGKAGYGVGMQCEDLELNSEVERAAEAFQLAAARKSQTLIVESSRRGVRVAADPRALRQIVTNIVSNAVKYCPAGATIRVIADIDDANGRGLVTVADNGRGISDAVMRRLGKPFVRAVEPQTEGSGLGLHLSQSLAEAMGASFAVKSSPNGATIVLGLPLANSSAERRLASA